MVTASIVKWMPGEEHFKMIGEVDEITVEKKKINQYITPFNVMWIPEPGKFFSAYGIQNTWLASKFWIPEFSLTNPESRKRGNPESKFYGQQI